MNDNNDPDVDVNGYNQWKILIWKLCWRRRKKMTKLEVESFDREEEEKYWGGIYETTFGLNYLDSVWNIKFLAVIES